MAANIAIWSLSFSPTDEAEFISDGITSTKNPRSHAQKISYKKYEVIFNTLSL
jgi:hypothetical protein